MFLPWRWFNFFPSSQYITLWKNLWKSEVNDPLAVSVAPSLSTSYVVDGGWDKIFCPLCKMCKSAHSIAGVSVKMYTISAAQGQKTWWGQFFGKGFKRAVLWREVPVYTDQEQVNQRSTLVLLLYWGCCYWCCSFCKTMALCLENLHLTSLSSAWLWCQMARKGLVKDGK